MNPNDNLKRAAAFVSKCPPAIQGAGGDSRTLGIANVLVWDFALSPSEALTLFSVWCSGCQPPWSEEDQLSKLRSAIKQPHRKPRGWRLLEKPDFAKPLPPPPKPKPLTMAEKIENVRKLVGSDLPTKADFWDASSIRLCDEPKDDGRLFIEAMFRDDDLVNVVETRPGQHDGHVKPAGHGITLPKKAMLDRLSWRFFPDSFGTMIRPNPMDGHGVRDANVAAYRFMLIEFDDMPLDLQLGLLGRVRLPVAAIIYSGGKSMHGLIKCVSDTFTKDEWDLNAKQAKRVFKLAGADMSTVNPSRMTRLPGSMRRAHDGSGIAMQELIYLNPTLDPDKPAAAIFP